MIWDLVRCKPEVRSNDLAILDESDFPALYQAANSFSSECQTKYFNALRLQLFLLVLAACISLLDSREPLVAMSQAAVLLFALLFAGYLFFEKPDRHWYSARAVAESVKTITWRFVTRAEPFSGDEESARATLARRLNDVVEQNRDVTKRFRTNLEEQQISRKMEELRAASFEERKDAYLRGRVKDQHLWYAGKASTNDCLGKIFFSLLAVFILSAIALSISRVHFSAASQWPTEIFVTVASVLLTWIQSRRFSELAAAYTLAAFEINTMQINTNKVNCNEKLSDFVRDAENAFSREHTQWAARRDE